MKMKFISKRLNINQLLQIINIVNNVTKKLKYLLLFMFFILKKIVHVMIIITFKMVKI